jgi:uncharacterized protein (TIGR02266 family)
MIAKGADRRTTVRVPLNLLVQYRNDSADALFCEYALDISEGGIFIRSDNPQDSGSMLYLQFVLKNGIRLIEGLGKVAHISPFGSKIRGMGIQFVNLDENSRDTIRLLVVSRSELKDASPKI